MISNPNTDTPVLRLHRDILGLIFTMNADMFSNTDALKMARHTSQVCTGWREVMLEMPSFWGKLMDLDSLLLKSEDWAKEVFRRSACSLLWIKSNNPGTMRGMSEFRAKSLFSLLNNHWARIQKLVVNFNVTGLQSYWDSWYTLYLPSPHLQVFQLIISGKTMTASRPLFANDAPSLRQFHTGCFSFNMAKTFDTMPHLEEIGIHGFAEIKWLNRPSFVKLPRLRCLKLFTDFRTSITLLDHIIAPPNCSLTFQPYFISTEDLIHDSLKASLQPLSKFVQRYLLSQTLKKISLTCSYSSFRFQDTSNFPKDHESGLLVSISCRQIFPTHLTSVMLEAFSIVELSTVEELRWDVPDLFSSTLFKYFLYLLPSIKIIETGERTIEHLIHVQDEVPDLLFPLLQIVKLNKLNLSSANPFNASGAISPFLRSRKEGGHPIDILDLSQCNAHTLPPLEFLDQIPGLKILWPCTGLTGNQVVQYEIGSGDYPEASWFYER